MALPVAPGPVALHKTSRVVASYQWRFAVVLVLQVTTVLSTLVASQLLGRLIGRVSAGQADTGCVDRIVLTIIAVTLVGALIDRFAQKYTHTLGESVFAELRERMINRVVHLPLSAVGSAGTGDFVGCTTTNVSHIEFLMRVGIPQVLMRVVTIVFTLLAAAVAGPLLVLGLLVIAPSVWSMMRWYLPISIPAYRAESAVQARPNGAASETAEHAETVDALSIGARRERAIMISTKEAWSLERYTAALRVRLFMALDVAWRAPVVAVLLWGGFLAGRGYVTLEAITAVALCSTELCKPMGQLVFWIDQVQIAQASLSRILGVKGVSNDRAPAGQEPQGTRIVLNDVRSFYREGIEMLHRIDLELVPGERLAVVRPSGLDRSTLGRMLAGINPPTSGSVSVDGMSLTGLTEDELRHHVTLVAQEHHVFAGIVADNVRLGRPGASDGTVREAIETIGANTWVDELSGGMDAMVGSGHLELSPAQTQEAALARLVLLNPYILILDEATSLLDPRAARTLGWTLFTVLTGRTVIEMAHRLYATVDADRVAIVMDGRTVELGTHDGLMALGGEYASLWQAWNQEQPSGGAAVPSSDTRPVHTIGTVRTAGTAQTTLPIKTTTAALHRSPVAEAGPYHPNPQTCLGLRCSTKVQAVRFLGRRVVPLSRSRCLAVSWLRPTPCFTQEGSFMPSNQPPPPPSRATPSAFTTPPHRAASSTRPTLGELIARISENISTLVHGEIGLAKAKSWCMTKEIELRAGLLAAAGVLALFVFGLVPGTLTTGLSHIMSLWVTFLVMMLILALIVVPMALIGIKRLEAAKVDTPTSQKGLKESVNAIKEAVTSGLQRGNAR